MGIPPVVSSANTESAVLRADDAAVEIRNALIEDLRRAAELSNRG